MVAGDGLKDLKLVGASLEWSPLIRSLQTVEGKMHLIAERSFDIDDPIFVGSRRCRDILFALSGGGYVLYSLVDHEQERLVRLNTMSAVSWLNACPEEFGMEWAE